jgi:hypothetical protein
MPEKYRRSLHHDRVQSVERMRHAWQVKRETVLVLRLVSGRGTILPAVYWPYGRWKSSCEGGPISFK